MIDKVILSSSHHEAAARAVADIPEGPAAEGVHLGAMAGTVDLVERVSTGIEMREDFLRTLENDLPRHADFRGPERDQARALSPLAFHDRPAVPSL